MDEQARVKFREMVMQQQQAMEQQQQDGLAGLGGIIGGERGQAGCPPPAWVFNDAFNTKVSPPPVDLNRKIRFKRINKEVVILKSALRLEKLEDPLDGLRIKVAQWLN